ncbi:peptidase G2 autoproteolytic cleavage domain-containing protein [Niallia sp. RD1]|uniref:peptidase G2 autoproteolytic cleavage domain-containing protein n=1 Tax=Niallia sp. RD1 TaxID=2962858 RepID=UPI0020C1A405|nr:peptidase G2 autoproteolytic cleavage domain-containing protein [Niallia sp. RD1]UTI42095.1 peptidase G2 [Niallia sp. RD1]
MKYPYQQIGTETTRIFRNLVNKIFGDIEDDMKYVTKSIDDTNKRISNLILSSSDFPEIVDARQDAEGVVSVSLKERLDKEYNKLLSKIKRTVYVTDFGAVGDGITDDTEAFRKAMGTGKVRVVVPAGVYVVRGLKIPSWVELVGDGMGLTIIILHEDTPATEWVITNQDYINGNRNISIKGMTLDWNKSRQGGVSATGGQHSSCLSLAKVKFAWIKEVEGINPGLHSFDITAPTYDHLPDTDYTKDGCRFVWIDNCVGSGYGDDGITTHYSEYIWISNNHLSDPDGDAHEDGVSNSNGIEIDDGSKHVWVINNYTTGNIRGVEVKAHTEWSAAQDVHIIGHTSYQDVRAYDFRHIGHHTVEDPDSTTAYDVVMTNCTAIEPVFNDLYAGLTPRALTISAYVNVNISGFTAIGDPTYNYDDNPVIAVQYKSRNIGLHNINIRGFKKASTDIRLIGGDQKTDNINISNVQIYKSAKEGIGIGSDIYHVNLTNITMIGENGQVGLSSVNSQDSIVGVHAEGYTLAASIAGNDYVDFVPNNVKGGTRIASTSGYAKTETSTIISSTSDSKATGDKTAVIASSNSEAAGEGSVVIASSGGSRTEGGRDAIIGSNNSKTTGSTENGKVILASNGVVNDNNYSVRGGYGDSENPSIGNTKWELDSISGTGKFTGAVTGASSFSDYAEYFESLDGEKIKSGFIVTLENGKIRKANKNEIPLGVISETAGNILGQATYHWQNRFLTNEFGGLILEEKTVGIQDDETGEYKEEKHMLPVENPEFDINEQYVSREERDEWNIVGLLGQVRIRIDETVQENGFISPNDGIGTSSDNGWKVMKITTPYDESKGYGVALCFVHPM